MTDGTSQGLFIVVAIVIFGIFVVLAYILFEDTLSPALASMFNVAISETTLDLEYGNQIDYDATVPDKHLQIVIRDTLGLSDGEEITIADLKSPEFTILVANITSGSESEGTYAYKHGEINIKSLEGLQHAVNLDTISLHGNSVESLEPIANLTKLRTLNVNQNESITDLSPLKNLTEMRSLMIEGNPFSDISHLKNLKKMTRLNIGATNVTNVDVLKYLPQIGELYVPHLNLGSSDFLQDFTNLWRLDIRNATFSDVIQIPSTVTHLRDVGKDWKLF